MALKYEEILVNEKIISMIKDLMQLIPKLLKPDLKEFYINDSIENRYESLVDYSGIVIKELDKRNFAEARSILRMMNKISKTLKFDVYKFEIAEFIMAANKLLKLDYKFNGNMEQYEEED